MFGMTPAEIDAQVEKAMADLDREDADQRRSLSQSVLYLIRENERLTKRVVELETRFIKHVDPYAIMPAAMP